MKVTYKTILEQIEETVKEADNEGLVIGKIELSQNESRGLVRELVRRGELLFHPETNIPSVIEYTGVKIHLCAY